MPDRTITPEALAARAKRAAEIARRDRVVERCDPVLPKPGELVWLSITPTLMTAGDGRYAIVRLPEGGWKVSVYHDGLELGSFGPVALARYAHKICAGVELGMRLERMRQQSDTAVHQVRYEVTGESPL